MLLPEYNKGDRGKNYNELCLYCSKKMSQLYDICRKVDDSNRWAPFKSLKSEKLYIWEKND